MAEIVEATSFWAVKPAAEPTPLPGGCCNQVLLVRLPKSEAILRIYNNCGDEGKILFEHGLLQLCEMMADLSSMIPNALPSLTGQRFVRLSSGAHACLCRRIPGRTPPLTASAARAIGGAAARILQSLAGLPASTVLAAARLPPDIPLESLPNPPFRFLWHAHSAFGGSQDAVLTTMALLEGFIAKTGDEIASRTADTARVDLAFLRGASLAMAARLSADAGGVFASLPQQLIHADLHAGNILVEPVASPSAAAAAPASAAATATAHTTIVDAALPSSAASAAVVASAADHDHDHGHDHHGGDEHVREWRVTGILDWEFATIDWRALEAVIALSKFLPQPEEQRWALLDAWMDGFVGAGGRLTAVEAQLFPDLMVLRHLVGFIYFLGNDPSGAAAASRISSYACRIRWIEESADKLRALAGRAVAAGEAAGESTGAA